MLPGGLDEASEPRELCVDGRAQASTPGLGGGGVDVVVRRGHERVRNAQYIRGGLPTGTHTHHTPRLALPNWRGNGGAQHLVLRFRHNVRVLETIALAQTTASPSPNWRGNGGAQHLGLRCACGEADRHVFDAADEA
jgi:hypothetical protein